MRKIRTKEHQYNSLLDLADKKGINQLGLMMNQVWNDDPRRLTFVLSRYKFVSKMLEGYNEVLEVGCGDAWPSRIVKQAVKNLTVSDFDPVFIENAKLRNDPDWPVTFLLHDMIKGSLEKKYDAIYSIDVLEHIDPKNEIDFVTNISKSIRPNGVAIIGIPSIESQDYSSEISRQGHVNCKSGKDLKSFLNTFFQNVFLFSMNDEVIHTGFTKLAHYLIALCINPKRDNR